jgi:hypothetical protein
VPRDFRYLCTSTIKPLTPNAFDPMPPYFPLRIADRDALGLADVWLSESVTLRALSDRLLHWDVSSLPKRSRMAAGVLAASA